MTASVRLERVTKRYGDLTALREVSLDVRAGEFAVLLGPSGCGKSTLLAVLGGFEVPQEGRVLIAGREVTHEPPTRRPTTTVFQDYALFPHMSLVDNVGFGLRMSGVGRRERRERAREFLDLVGLRESAGKRPHEVSGGQRQRVALARALAVDPDVLLLDEPLGALDLKLRRQMQDELKEIQRRVGTTFLHVTHDQEEAMVIADKIVVMNAGRIEDEGTPEDVYLRPRGLFSASFMGEVNFLPGRVRRLPNSPPAVETAVGLFALPMLQREPNRWPTGAPIRVAIRPEHMRVGDASSKDTKFDLGAVRIVDIGFTGVHYRARCEWISAPELPLIAHLPQSASAHAGDELTVSVDCQRVMLLPDLDSSPRSNQAST